MSWIDSMRRGELNVLTAKSNVGKTRITYVVTQEAILSVIRTTNETQLPHVLTYEGKIIGRTEIRDGQAIYIAEQKAAMGTQSDCERARIPQGNDTEQHRRAEDMEDALKRSKSVPK